MVPASTARPVLWETILQNDRYRRRRSPRLFHRATPHDVAPIKIDSEEQERTEAADQQPARLRVARMCVLTLGILKKLRIIRRAHRFIDSS